MRVLWPLVQWPHRYNQRARGHFGFWEMDKKDDCVEQCLEEVYKAIEKLCNVKR